MKQGVPKLNFGFYKDGFRINSRQFHPLNMSINGLKLESDREYKAIDPIDLVESFSSLNIEDATRLDRVKALKEMLKKINF